MSRQAVPIFSEDKLLQAYHRTVRPLYAFVSRRVGGDVGLAEDLVQETWMRALETWPANGVPDEPLAWLTHVAHNRLISYFRRARPQPMDPASIDLELARNPAKDVARRGEIGIAQRVELAEAQLHVQELELEITKVDVDLAVIQRQIEQRRTGR